MIEKLKPDLKKNFVNIEGIFRPIDHKNIDNDCIVERIPIVKRVFSSKKKKNIILADSDEDEDESSEEEEDDDDEEEEESSDEQ